MKKIILAIATLGLVVVGAQAADMNNPDGFYVGINNNSIQIKGDATSNLNQTGIYGGFRHGNLGFEISRSEGKVDQQKTSFTDFSVIPRLNVAKDFDLLGKVGMRHSTISGSGIDDSGNSLVVGVGAEYAFLPNWSARLMVDYSEKAFGYSSPKTGNSYKATNTIFGVAYKF
jgi:outer membrane autotransporter protein